MIISYARRYPPIVERCSPVWRAVGCSSAIALFAITTPVAAQQQHIQRRQLGPVVASLRDTLGWPVTLRALSDGRVFVNDMRNRRLLLVDSTFTHTSLIADS